MEGTKIRFLNNAYHLPMSINILVINHLVHLLDNTAPIFIASQSRKGGNIAE